jgi:predicted enzyme related to lactoylglutathione lyase
MPITNALASLAVRDLKTARAWYEMLLGRAPDATPMPEVAEWKFGGGGWLQVYQLRDRAGSGSVTLAVSDIEAQAAQLEKLGIDPGERPSSAQVKTIMITDPDGNHLAFAQALDPAMAR